MSKKDASDNDDSSDDEDSRKFGKKDSNYLCAHLNKKNRLSIEQDKTLFNIGAKTYIAKSIDDFTAGIYTPASLPAINTASKEAKLLGFGKRTLICATDTDGETHTLNLSKVQYLPNCGINIFGAKKLLGKGDIRIEDGNLVVNREGLGIFRFNENIIIIKAS
jgi:hypothetical protein